MHPCRRNLRRHPGRLLPHRAFHRLPLPRRLGARATAMREPGVRVQMAAATAQRGVMCNSAEKMALGASRLHRRRPVEAVVPPVGPQRASARGYEITAHGRHAARACRHRRWRNLPRRRPQPGRGGALCRVRVVRPSTCAIPACFWHQRHAERFPASGKRRARPSVALAPPTARSREPRAHPDAAHVQANRRASAPAARGAEPQRRHAERFPARAGSGKASRSAAPVPLAARSRGQGSNARSSTR